MRGIRNVEAKDKSVVSHIGVLSCCTAECKEQLVIHQQESRPGVVRVRNKRMCSTSGCTAGNFDSGDECTCACVDGVDEELSQSSAAVIVTCNRIENVLLQVNDRGSHDPNTNAAFPARIDPEESCAGLTAAEFLCLPTDFLPIHINRIYEILESRYVSDIRVS